MPKKSRPGHKWGRTERAKRKIAYLRNKEAKAAALVKDIVIKRPFCTVCKRFQTPEEEITASVYDDDDSDIDDFYVPGNNRGKIGTRWTSTQEPSPVSGTEVLFKLFEFLDREFDAGNVCKDCAHLMDQMDGLQFQLACLKDTLAARVDKFYDRDIDYKKCLGHELVVRTPEGTVSAGEKFAKKALDKVLKPSVDNLDDIRDRVTIVSGAFMKGMNRSKALVERGGIGSNHRTKKLVKDKREYEKNHVSGAHPERLAVADDLRSLDRGIRHIEESLVWKRWTDPRHIEHVLMRGNFDHSFVINHSHAHLGGRKEGKKDLKYANLFYMGNIYRSFLRRGSHVYSTATETDGMVNRWVCASGCQRQCPAVVVTTLDNSRLLVESLADENGVVRCHNHGDTPPDMVYHQFWGQDITTVMRNHPGLSDKDVLETYRFVMADEETRQAQASDEAMLHIIAILRHFQEV